jgi:hypothetical protein
MNGSSVLEAGSFRLQVRTPRGWVRVGNFRSLTGVDTYALDLITHAPDVSIDGLRVEFLNKRQWKRVWGWAGRQC